MTTRTINGNNAGNTINVEDFSSLPNTNTGYKASGWSSSLPTALQVPFFDTDLVINTFDATGGTDFVVLSGLTTNSGVFFTSITINGGGGSQIVTGIGFAETISTGAANDTINSGAGDDTITGGGNAESMVGSDGSDIHNIAGAELGGDTFNDTGTSGSDTINVTGALSGISYGVAGTIHSSINVFLPNAAGATYAGIEIFNGNNIAFTGINNASAIYLSGFGSATQVGAINTFNATGGADYVNVSTADSGVTITGNNAGNTIDVSDFSSLPNTNTGYKVTGLGFTTSPAELAPFFDTDVVINTLNATGGTDFVVLSGLTTNSGVSFNSITITGGGGSQNVTGSGFAETISTGAGHDTINAGAGNDTITGGDGADSMDGGDGSDIYNIAGGQLGGDTFNDTGTIGSDTIEVTGALSTFLSFGKAGTNYVLPPTSAGATYQGIEIFDGNNFAISGVNNGSDIFDLSGFSSATQVGAINTFDATGGTDYVNLSTADNGVTITGAGGSQIVVGSDYADTISTGSGNDTIDAGAGNDTITGGDGADSMDGGDGDDTFNIAGLQVGGDTIIGGSGNDTIKNTSASALGISSFGPSGSGTTATYSSIEILFGNNQAINGTNAANEVVNLSLIGQVQNVTAVSMADGADTVWTAASHSGQVTDYDGGGSGSTPQDTINLVLTPLQLGAFGVTDINTLNNYVAAPTNKTLGPSGGTNNIASLEFKARRFELATANVLDDGQIYNITGCLIPINNVVQIGTTPGFPGPNFTDLAGKNSLVVGTVAANNINAGDGDDLVFGLAGNDSITGGAGDDCLFGGAGDDTFFANLSEAEFDELQGGSGVDTLQRTSTGGQGNLVLNQFLATNGIERVNLDAGGSNRAIDGNGFDNVLNFSATTLLSGNVFGQGGNDTITATNSATRTYDGGAGNDVLNGGSVADNLIGGTGDDAISGNGGNDTIKGGADADSLNGGDGDDTFLANLSEAEFDTLQGGDGIDTLQRTTDGGQGNLVLNQFLVTNGIERVNLDAGGSNRAIDGNGFDNVLNFSATTLLSGNVFGQGGNDTITATNSATRTYDGGAGNDLLNGGSVADNLIGGTGDDTISGGGGNDTIVGGTGLDSLTGGGGSDRFVFNNASEGTDTITDFDPTADLFNVSSSGFATIGGLGTLAASRFTIGAAATTTSQRFIYDSSNGNLFFDVDGLGGTSQVQIAQLSTGLALSNTNFNIV